ncbi:Ger(x)C family spore germination protein [Paenibacillus sp. SYP-B3998]|uniref:Ger(X)C family spore germination protein n=1 Tax=Paenibacillus sp. SYP-B3998 TaxID=2678564 RepID=A0A6G3ZY63_9BACL|nr:Ger(x)C family spore germination protein [Paenibacillus sp. SYP-B3998]NEW07030.1 Ger(x)C family spore germination protein [Paenibacillus sp. SYP-B3998]
MAKRNRMLAFGLTLAFCVTLLTGCWDRTETNDIAFVLTSSIDLEDNGQVRIAFMLPLPGSMGGASGGGGGTSGSNKSYYIDSEVGDTAREATSKLQMRLSRRLFLSHRRTIVIGEKFAKNGIGSMFDIVPRTPESRMTCFLVVTSGKGYDLLNAEPKFERFPAEVIRELTKSRQSMATSTKDIGIALSFGSDPVMAFLDTVESQVAKQPSQEIQFTGYGQFKGDRMIGIYKHAEADGLMWLRNQVREHSLTFPLVPGESGKNLSILVTGGHAAIKPILKGNKVSFDIQLDAKGSVREDLSEQDLNQSDRIHKVERKFAEQVKKSVQATIKQMQKQGTDSAQFGLIVWRKYPNVWNTKLGEKWTELFKEAEFHIKVDAAITETGLINQNVIKEGISR